MILNPPNVSIKSFAYDAEDNLLVAEDSSLNQRMGRVFDDACDEGYTLLIPRKEPLKLLRIVYVVTKVVKRDDDLLWWDLIPASLAFRSRPMMRIFND